MALKDIKPMNIIQHGLINHLQNTFQVGPSRAWLGVRNASIMHTAARNERVGNCLGEQCDQRITPYFHIKTQGKRVLVNYAWKKEEYVVVRQTFVVWSAMQFLG